MFLLRIGGGGEDRYRYIDILQMVAFVTLTSGYAGKNKVTSSYLRTIQRNKIYVSLFAKAVYRNSLLLGVIINRHYIKSR